MRLSKPNSEKSTDCQSKLLSRFVTRSTVSTTSKTDTLADRRYAGPFTFSGDTLFRVDFPGGYFDEHAYPNYLLTDRLGSVDMVVNINGAVVQHNGYYPYGEPWREPKGNHLLFSGKERLRHVVSDSDFGPRLLSTSLCLWKAPDRLSEKYPWLSPYAYCGANPVKFIDPTGNLIHIFSNDGTYYWKEINNHWDFYDDNDNVYQGNDDFTKNTRLALSSLMNGGPTGYNLVRIIAESEKDVQIWLGEKSSAAPNGKDVSWNMAGTPIPTTEGNVSDAVMDLGHEFGHILFTWFVDINKVWFKIPTIKGFREIKISDIYATHIENKLRAENGRPLRRVYSESSDGSEYGRILKIKNGKATSLYFDLNEKTNYKYYKGNEPFEYKIRKK